MTEHDEVRLGMRVRDVHGDVLGSVVRLGTGRFLIQRGSVVKESIIVPDRCVAAVNDGEVVLTCGHRELIEAMHNPPADVERKSEEMMRYAEPAPPRKEAGGVESLTERPDKVRVVRDEYSGTPGSSHEYQVRGKEEPREEPAVAPDRDPDSPVH